MGPGHSESGAGGHLENQVKGIGVTITNLKFAGDAREEQCSRDEVIPKSGRLSHIGDKGLKKLFGPQISVGCRNLTFLASRGGPQEWAKCYSKSF